MKQLIHKPFSGRKPSWRQGFVAIAGEPKAPKNAIRPRLSPIRRISLVALRSAA